MSSILDKLKEADKEHQKSGAEGTATPTQSAEASPAEVPSAAPAGAAESPATSAPSTPPTSSVSIAPKEESPAEVPPVAPAAPAGAAESPAVSAPPTPPASSASITPTPSVAPKLSESDAIGMVKKEPEPVADNQASGAQPFEPVDFDDPSVESDATTRGRKGLVEAGQVFLAGEEKGSVSTGRRTLYSALGLFLIFSGAYAALLFEVIPGVSISSVLGLFGGGAREEVSLQPQAPSVPDLAVAAGDNQSVALPLPKIDIQAEVDFNNLQANESDLLTEEGRRQYAQKLAVIAGIIAPEDVQGGGQGDELLPELFDVTGSGQTKETQVNTYEDIAEVNTAEFSRLQKMRIDANTPSDRFLAESIEVYSADGEKKISFLVAGNAEVAESATENEQGSEAGSVPETSAPAISSKSSKSEQVVVKPSKKGKEREQMLKSARAFYIKNNYVAAESAYRSVLQKYPKNISAMRGLALVAIATGRYQVAAATYLNILENYPSDSRALADLANLRLDTLEDFYGLESTLRRALGKTPEADSRLYFTLGNMYVEQQRWTEAQEAYFNAYTNTSSNPDYAYNLAVILDYLNKPSQAAIYYKQAAKLARHTPSGFDVDVVSNRIRQLGEY